MDILANLAHDRSPRYLLTRDGNPKTVKGVKQGYLTAILHLAPASLSGANVCAHATAGCRAACLNTAGRGGIFKPGEKTNAIQVARIQRTRLFRNDRIEFMRRLKREMDLHIRNAAKADLVPVFRLNGTSDLPWEKLPFNGHKNVFAAYPDVQFYDYTKYPVRLRDTTIPNYHLTFSLAESNRANAIAAIRAGVNVAAVMRYNKGSIPTTISFGGSFRKVINGDDTDLRFLDGTGNVVALKAKGKARHDTSGFVLDV